MRIGKGEEKEGEKIYAGRKDGGKSRGRLDK